MLTFDYQAAQQPSFVTLAQAGTQNGGDVCFQRRLDSRFRGNDGKCQHCLASYIQSRAEESFLVLVPRRFIGYRLAEAIGVDAKTTFDEEALEHPIAQEAFIGLSLVSNPKDCVSARAWLGLHGTKRQHGSRRNTEAYTSLPSDIEGQDLIRQLADGDVKPSGTGSLNLRRRARMAIELIERDASATELIDLLFDQAVAEEEKNDERRRWLVDDLQELRESALEILTRQDSPDLRDVVDTMRYRIATRAPLRNSDEEEPHVRIMTLHSAKGLEADNVVIAGVADQFMPGNVSDAEEIAEQRRLLYVAVTRAKDRLILSWPRMVRTADLMRYGGRTSQVITVDGVTWGTTSRSTLLPQGLTGVVNGETLLT